MRILVACEESQEVCKAFREKGHEAYSCDIQECSGGHPEWHIKQDVLPLLNGDCEFMTMDGTTHSINGKWDMIIAHPPCTYLSYAGNKYLSVEKYGVAALERAGRREDAFNFFMEFVRADCGRKAIENPVGYINTRYRKPDQTIHPYFFAEHEKDRENYHMKRTCLWLFGLGPLERKTFLPIPAPMCVEKNGKKRYRTDFISGSKKEAKKLRSKTFPGIAKAMAEQWG